MWNLPTFTCCQPIKRIKIVIQCRPGIRYLWARSSSGPTVSNVLVKGNSWEIITSSSDSPYLSFTPDSPSSSFVTVAGSPVLCLFLWQVRAMDWLSEQRSSPSQYWITLEMTHSHSPLSLLMVLYETEMIVIGREGVQVKCCDKPF